MIPEGENIRCIRKLEINKAIGGINGTSAMAETDLEPRVPDRSLVKSRVMPP